MPSAIPITSIVYSLFEFVLPKTFPGYFADSGPSMRMKASRRSAIQLQMHWSRSRNPEKCAIHAALVKERFFSPTPARIGVSFFALPKFYLATDSSIGTAQSISPAPGSGMTKLAAPLAVATGLSLC